MGTLVLVLASLLAGAAAQGTCQSDRDCDEPLPCCSGYGYCGKGEGFCTPATRPTTPAPPPEGCLLEDTEIVGGDLEAGRGGGGLGVATAELCGERCRDNPFCKWFTWDRTRELCYLKSHRGPLRTRPASVFTSGATFRDGCVPDPPCAPPYAPALHGSCLLRPALPSSRAEAAAVCEASGGRLVRSYEHGGYGDGEAWHWVDTGDTAHCWACRPARWAEGVASLDCGLNLAYVCQRRGVFPSPPPPRPPTILELGLYTELDTNQLEAATPLRRLSSRTRSRRPHRRRRRRFFANPYLSLIFG